MLYYKYDQTIQQYISGQYAMACGLSVSVAMLGDMIMTIYNIGGRLLKTPEKTGTHYCQQCKKDMGNEWLLGAVCGKCCRENHKRVMGK